MDCMILFEMLVAALEIFYGFNVWDVFFCRLLDPFGEGKVQYKYSNKNITKNMSDFEIGAITVL